MTTAGTAAVKAVQRETWASGDYAAVGARIHPIAESLVQRAGLRAGWRVLDVATGTGNAALAAARCGCTVVGVDYVPRLLERARQRVAIEGFAVDFREGDAEDLPFPEASFDAVLSVVGVMFAPDQARAAAELLRVCRPGGTIALASWTPSGHVGRMFAEIARRAPGPPPEHTPVEWGDAHRLRELFGDGVSRWRMTEQEFVLRSTSPEHYLAFMSENFGPFVRLLAALDTPARGRLSKQLLEIYRADNVDDESLAIPAAYLEAVGQRQLSP